MNWPSFALITYGFLLALLLAGIILRSMRETKRRYQRALEEKEQKLAAMQMDLEDTMMALEEQTAVLETQGSMAKKQGENSLLSVQQRLMDFQGMLVNLQIRLACLEQAACYKAAGQTDPNEKACGDPLLMPEQPRGIQGTTVKQKESGALRPPTADLVCPLEENLPRQQAVVLLQRGMTVAQVSRELKCSWTEATLLYSQWRRGCLKADLESGRRAESRD